MRITLAVLAIALLVSSRAPAQTGAATTNGACSLANSGHNNTNLIVNCGVGKEQGDKIVRLLNTLLAKKDGVEINAKLDELIEIAAKPAQQVVNCANVGNCAGTNSGTQNFNQYGPIAFAMSDAQEAAAAEYLAKQPNLTGQAAIVYEWSAPDGQAAATQLQKLLSSMGVNASIGNAGMYMVYAGAPSFAGLSFTNVKDSNRALADALEAALKAAGVVSSPLKRDERPLQTDTLFITIRKP
jgi:hypothetical protein